MVTAITVAVTPRSDASGGTAAAKVNCSRPSSAEAVPARPPCPASASAVAFGMNSPVHDTSTSNGTSSAHTDREASASASSVSAATSASTTPTPSSRRGPTRPTTAALTRPASTIPSPFTANTTE